MVANLKVCEKVLKMKLKHFWQKFVRWCLDSHEKIIFFTSISTIIHTFYIALSKERICGLMSSTMFELPFCPINSILFFVPFCWATRCHSKVKALDNLIFFQPHKTARSPMQFNVRYKHFTKKAFLTFITQTFSFWRIFVLASTRSLCLFFMSATWVVRKNFKED